MQDNPEMMEEFVTDMCRWIAMTLHENIEKEKVGDTNEKEN